MEILQRSTWTDTPIVVADPETKQRLASLAERIQIAKETDPDANTAELERRIDETVYTLYGLKTQDIAVIKDALP